MKVWSVRGRKRSMLLGVALYNVMLLTACGGGSSGSGSSPPSPSQGQPSSVSLTTNSISVTAATDTGAPVVNNPMSFSASAKYYAVSYIGTAISQIAMNDETSISYNTQNSTVGATSKLVYAIGATLYGTMPPNGSLGINSIAFTNPAVMGAGTYSDTLTIKVCADAACQQPVGSGTVNIAYTITGNPIPDATITVYPNVMVEAPSSTQSIETGTVTLTAGSLPPTGAYVSMTPSMSGVVTSTEFQPGAIPISGANVVDGKVTFSLDSPSIVGAGAHSDTFQINVCFDSACTKPAVGSPWTVNVSYIVDPSPGVDYTQKTLALSIAGMVWDGRTGMLYAIIPGYSAQYPNTLAEIDPAAATVVSTVQLNGGVGRIEPGTLSVSDDGNYLYVAVSDPSESTDSVDRIRTSDFGVDLQIVLPADDLVSTIREAPGSPHTLAIDLAPPSPGLYIYNDAVASGSAAAGTGGGSTSFVWGADDTTLYADVQSVGDATLETIANSPTGPNLTRSQRFSALNGSTTFGNMHYADGEIVWDSGATFNPTSYEPGKAFPFYASAGNPTTASAAAVDSTLNRAYFLTDDQPANATSGVITLQAFDLANQNLAWLGRFPSQNGTFYLTRWGSNGLAFAESGATETLVLISGSIVTK